MVKMDNLRERIYKFFLNAGLFFVVPLAIRLPEGLGRFILKLKAYVRFMIGSYRSYINRKGLRDIAIRNISQTLNLNERMARQKIRKLMYLEVIAERNGFLFDKYDLTSLSRDFDVRGLEILDRELKREKGIIFVTIHSGDTVLFMLFLSLMGYNIYGLFDGAILSSDSTDPLLRFARLKDLKIDGKIGKLYTGRGLKGLFDVLNSKGIIVWMIDISPQNTKRIGFVNFLGKEVCVNTSFLEVAIRSGASIVPFIGFYDHLEDKHKFYIREPFDTRKGIREIYAFYEPYVRMNPESWLGWYYFDTIIKKKVQHV